MVLETKLMTNVTQEMFGEGHAIATAALGEKQMPSAVMNPKPLVASSATTLYGALAPELSSKCLREHSVSDYAESLAFADDFAFDQQATRELSLPMRQCGRNPLSHTRQVIAMRRNCGR